MRRTIELLALILFAGCSDTPTLQCEPNLAAMGCQELYPPTFQNLYDNILHPTCASGTRTCHTSDYAPLGLVFEDPDMSYALLLGTMGGRARVVPGDPSCSVLMERLEASDSSLRMPPGSTPLMPSELCTFSKWIANGAQR